MNSLEQFGWNEFHQSNHIKSENSSQPLGRVSSLQGFKYTLLTPNGDVQAELAGKMLYGAEPENLPKVGDWVYFLDYGDSGYIIDLLPRFNELARKTAGRQHQRQVLATNIDMAFIVQGLDRDFNPMKLERYATQLAACNIPTTVLLNKSDLVSDKEPFVQRIASLGRALDVIFCSTLTGDGLNHLRTKLSPGKTYILIGSSGVGKSSIVNVLNDGAPQDVGEVSQYNSKGRHTTTTRELFMLGNGSLLIDTPGMREFGVTSEDGALADEMFPAIDELSANCRYQDCKHINEPGCAVLNAIQTGQLDQMVYDSYIKLLKEQRRFEIHAEDRKRLNRQFGKIVKEANEFRKKFKS